MKYRAYAVSDSYKLKCKSVAVWTISFDEAARQNWRLKCCHKSVTNLFEFSKPAVVTLVRTMGFCLFNQVATLRASCGRSAVVMRLLASPQIQLIEEQSQSIDS